MPALARWEWFPGHYSLSTTNPEAEKDPRGGGIREEGEARGKMSWRTGG